MPDANNKFRSAAWRRLVFFLTSTSFYFDLTTRLLPPPPHTHHALIAFEKTPRSLFRLNVEAVALSYTFFTAGFVSQI